MTRPAHETPRRAAGRGWTATVARAAWRLVQGLDRRDPWWLRAIPGWCMERLLAANPRALLLVEWSPEMQRAAGQAADALPLRLAESGFRVRAFDDALGRERPLDEVLAKVAAGGGADHWYVNLLATRGDFPAALDDLS